MAEVARWVSFTGAGQPAMGDADPSPAEPPSPSCNCGRDTCAICLAGMDPEDTTVLACDHRYHRQCIDAWLQVEASPQRGCPLCRAVPAVAAEVSDIESARVRQTDLATELERSSMWPLFFAGLMVIIVCVLVVFNHVKEGTGSASAAAGAVAAAATGVGVAAAAGAGGSGDNDEPAGRARRAQGAAE